ARGEPVGLLLAQGAEPAVLEHEHAGDLGRQRLRGRSLGARTVVPRIAEGSLALRSLLRLLALLRVLARLHEGPMARTSAALATAAILPLAALRRGRGLTFGARFAGGLLELALEAVVELHLEGGSVVGVRLEAELALAGCVEETFALGGPLRDRGGRSALAGDRLAVAIAPA